MFISIKNLSFKYPSSDRQIINNLNLEIEKGSITVLLGLNGCGKTTLIKLLAGLLTYKEGSITYNSEELKTTRIKERSKIFSYVPQKTYAADDYFVRDYLSYGFINSLKFYESPKKEQLDKIQEISKQLNIEHLLDKKMGQISGGERQIVSVASCLLQNTEIILLDEPTSALDLKNQSLVLDVLKDLCDKKEKTILLTTHNPNHALMLGANVILMNEGQIIKQGKAVDIINIDLLKPIYGNSIIYSKDLPYKEVSHK